MSVAVLLGLAASALSLYAPVPQIVRALRTRSAEGLVWSSLVLSLMTFTVWVVYAVAVADHIQIVNNVLGLVLLVVMAQAALRAGTSGSYWSAALAVLATAVACTLLVGLTSPWTLALLGTVASSSRLFPQARLAMSGASLWGLCPWSTLLGWLGMASWVAYGLVVGDLGVTVASGLAVVMQSAIVACRLPVRRTLASLAAGRLGATVAHLVAPAATYLPYRTSYDLAA
ncbi:MAG: SemiSWEET family transporter [Nocardioidaceae bacterium]